MLNLEIGSLRRDPHGDSDYQRAVTKPREAWRSKGDDAMPTKSAGVRTTSGSGFARRSA